MVTVDVRGVQVMFPFPPYECQVAYMEKVIEAIDMKFDTALESPTGTGKTLSLLCSTLGWLQKQKTMFHLSFEDATQIASGKLLPRSGLPMCVHMENNIGQPNVLLKADKILELAAHVNQGNGPIEFTNTGGSAPPLSTFLPRIYYCSRTHSQLSQVIRELNRTMYKDIRTTVLGSRDQLCIHEKVSKERDSRIKTSMCRNMVSRRTCHYYNNWDKTPRDMLDNLFTENGNVPDIEDMVTIGEKHRICPFYRCRQMQETAELVLLPYNYIIDPQLRKIHKIDLGGSVVIFDEAHNLESICEEVVSVEISSINIALAIAELKDAIECLQLETEEIRSEMDNSFQTFGSGTTGSEKPKGPPFQLGDAALFLSMLFELEVKIEATFNDQRGLSLEGFPGKVFPGDRLLETFAGAGFSYDKADALSKLLLDITDYLQRETDVKPASAERGKNLDLLRSFISGVYLSLSKESALAIAKEKVNAGATNTENIAIDPKRIGQHFKLYIVKEEETADKPACTVLKFWCFSSSIAMRALKMNGVRTVIVTSGTLSPITHFTRNIGLDFGSTLENKHAANRNQVITGLVGTSPITECVLNGSFARRSDTKYALGVAECILALASSVPQGILVFFASYSLMYDLISKFKQLPYPNVSSKTYWDCMVEKKVVVIEPKQKNLLNKVRSEFTQGVRSGRGAMFFAVCRGKVSEGIDFSDADSRAVCVVGIPYSPLMDVRICLKRLYINEMAAVDNTVQSAQEWYVTEGYRAVNQALGRVIRHVNDFGVVALLDKRFAEVKKEYFPAWIRSSIKVFDKGSEFMAVTRKFFDDRKLEVKTSSMPLTPQDGQKRKTISGGILRKRSSIKLSSEVRNEYVMDYGLYSAKSQPSDRISKCEKLTNGDRSSLLSICTAEESSRSIKPASSVETFDAGLESGATLKLSQVIAPPIRKKLKLTRGGAIGTEENLAVETRIPEDVSLSPELRQAMLVNAKQFFELVSSINKHKQVAAFMKQFATKAKAITDIVKGLEELLLPRHPEAFLGASCLFDEQEHKQLFLQRYMVLQRKLGCS